MNQKSLNFEYLIFLIGSLLYSYSLEVSHSVWLTVYFKPYSSQFRLLAYFLIACASLLVLFKLVPPLVLLKSRPNVSSYSSRICFFFFLFQFLRSILFGLAGSKSFFIVGLVLTSIMSLIPFASARACFTLNSRPFGLLLSSLFGFIVFSSSFIYFAYPNNSLLYVQGRFTSFFPHTNFFAWIVSASVIYFSVHAFKQLRLKKITSYPYKSIITFLLLALSLFLLFTTGSRATLLSLFLTFLVLLLKLLTVKKNSYLLLILLVSMAIFALIFNLGFLDFDSVFGARNFDYSDLSGRDQILSDMFSDFISSPIFGKLVYLKTESAPLLSLQVGGIFFSLLLLVFFVFSFGWVIRYFLSSTVPQAFSSPDLIFIELFFVFIVFLSFTEGFLLVDRFTPFQVLFVICFHRYICLQNHRSSNSFLPQNGNPLS